MNIRKIKKEIICNRLVPLPIGYKDTACPKCGSIHLAGALLTPIADEQDPNIICKDCGSRIDEGVVY